MARRSEMQELADAIAKHAPADHGLWMASRRADCERIARALRRCALKLHRCAEADCNGETNARWEAIDKRETERFRFLCSSIGCGAKFTGDPRGYVARILFPPGPDGRRPYNTWGGKDDGWGVA